MVYSLHHSILYSGDQIFYDYSISFEGPYIVSLYPSSKAHKQAQDIDVQGMILAPGLIDLQIYGAKGKLFNNTQDQETLNSIHEHNLERGTTRYMVTLSTSSLETIFKAIDTVRKALEKSSPGLLGLHLEGPFINPEKRGAHFEEWVLKPKLEWVKQIMEYGKGVVKMMTIAPERFEPEALQYLAQTGILLSAGHSNATYEEAVHGFKSGIETVTHLYNAMSPLGSREPGLVGASLDQAHFASIIPDGIHVSFSSVRIAKRIMGNRLFLISDSVTETKEGPYFFKKGDNCFINEKGTLSGSAIGLIQGVENCVKKVGISLAESIRMASAYPAKVLSNPKITGILKPGSLADFIVFDSQYKIQHVFYEGQAFKLPQSIV